MIQVADITLLETNGVRENVVRIMDSETSQDWMIRSAAFVSTPLASANYILHFWKNGTVVIHETDRKPEVSDDDIRALSQWVLGNGWSELQVSERLLQNRGTFESWRLAFIAGLVSSPVLQKKEDEEIKRLMRTAEIERDQDNAAEANLGIQA